MIKKNFFLIPYILGGRGKRRINQTVPFKNNSEGLRSLHIEGRTVKKRKVSK
jgi:hypothetical protein